MTDLKYRIMCYVHEAPVTNPRTLMDVLGHFEDMKSTEIQAALRELEGSSYIKRGIGTYSLTVTIPAGVHAIEAEYDLRRRETLLQQELHLQREQQKARDQHNEEQKRLDQKISKLAILFAVIVGLLAPVVAVLAGHFLPLWFWL